jgi:hypothetical protein
MPFSLDLNQAASSHTLQKDREHVARLYPQAQTCVARALDRAALVS